MWKDFFGKFHAGIFFYVAVTLRRLLFRSGSFILSHTLYFIIISDPLKTIMGKYCCFLCKKKKKKSQSTRAIEYTDCISAGE